MFESLTWPAVAVIVTVIGTIAGLIVKLIDNIFGNKKPKTVETVKANDDDNKAEHQRMQDQITLLDKRIDLLEKDLEVLKTKQTGIDAGLARLEKKIDALIERLLGSSGNKP